VRDLLLEVGVVLEAADLALQVRVLGLLRRKLVLDGGEPAGLQHEHEPQQDQRRARAGRDHRGDPPRLEAFVDFDWKEVDLRHPCTPGRARPTATAINGSASASASGAMSRSACTRPKARASSTLVFGIRSRSMSASPSSREPPPESATREIRAPAIFDM